MRRAAPALLALLVAAGPDSASDGVALYRAGRWAEAAAAFRASGDPAALYDLGDALAQRGDFAGALHDFEAALARDPGDADAAANRALMLRLLEAASVAGAPVARAAGSVDTAMTGTPGPHRSAPQSTGNGGIKDLAGGSRAARGGDAPRGPPGPPRPPGPDDPAGNGGTPSGAASAGRGRSQPGGGDAQGAAVPRLDGSETWREGEHRQADAQWIATIPDSPARFLRLRLAREQQRRLQAGLAAPPADDPW